MHGKPAVDILNEGEHLGRTVLGPVPATTWGRGRITRLGLLAEMQAAAPALLTQVQEEDNLPSQVLTQCWCCLPGDWHIPQELPPLHPGLVLHWAKYREKALSRGFLQGMSLCWTSSPKLFFSTYYVPRITVFAFLFICHNNFLGTEGTLCDTPVTLKQESHLRQTVKLLKTLILSSPAPRCTQDFDVW